MAKKPSSDGIDDEVGSGIQDESMYSDEFEASSKQKSTPMVTNQPPKPNGLN